MVQEPSGEPTLENKRRGEMAGIFYFIFLSVPLVMAGCSNSAPTLQLPDNLSPEIKSQVEKGWSKILDVCPGFLKYGSEMTFERIDDRRGLSTDMSLNRIDIVFKIAYSKVIPVEYYAFGHTCYYGISQDGKSLHISKRPCVAVCKDRIIETNGVDYVEFFR